MARSFISPGEGVELKRLYADYVTAAHYAAGVIASKDMNSPEFLQADCATTVLCLHIREILGTVDQHWMAS
jgi:hypothetical protein